MSGPVIHAVTSASSPWVVLVPEVPLASGRFRVRREGPFVVIHVDDVQISRTQIPSLVVARLPIGYRVDASVMAGGSIGSNSGWVASLVAGESIRWTATQTAIEHCWATVVLPVRPGEPWPTN